MTKRKIKELIEAGEWNSDEFKARKLRLLSKLNIQDPEQETSYIHTMFDDLQKRLNYITKKVEKIESR